MNNDYEVAMIIEAAKKIRESADYQYKKGLYKLKKKQRKNRELSNNLFSYAESICKHSIIVGRVDSADQGIIFSTSVCSVCGKEV